VEVLRSSLETIMQDEIFQLMKTKGYALYAKSANTEVVRICNTCGPHMLPNDDRVFSNSMVHVRKREHHHPLRCSSTLVFHPLPTDKFTQRQPNNALAKEKLVREPKVQLEVRFKETIAFSTIVGSISDITRKAA
jgi:hypothetical protein